MAVAAVSVVGWSARGQVGEAEFLVSAHQAPLVGAAGDPPGLVLPGGTGGRASDAIRSAPASVWSIWSSAA